MGNNHACPVLQSGAADVNDLLRGHGGLFLASEVIRHQMALRQTFGIDGPPNHHTYARAPLLAFGSC